MPDLPPGFKVKSLPEGYSVKKQAERSGNEQALRQAAYDAGGEPEPGPSGRAGMALSSLILGPAAGAMLGGGGLVGGAARAAVSPPGLAAIQAAAALAQGRGVGGAIRGAAEGYGEGKLGGAVGKLLRMAPQAWRSMRTAVPAAQEAAAATRAAGPMAPAVSGAVAAPVASQAAPMAAKAAPTFAEGTSELAKLLGQQPGVTMTQAASRVATKAPDKLIQVGEGIESQVVDLLTRQGLSKQQVANALREMSAQPGSGFKPLRPSEARQMVEMIVQQMGAQ